MAQLHVKINRQDKSALFWGPGTFRAKDAIKQLGIARWKPQQKAWEVKNFSLSTEEVKKTFPDATIEISGESPASTSTKVTEATTSSTQSLPQSQSVSEFIYKIKGLLKEAFPNTIYVRGILSQVKISERGQAFMDLRDQEYSDEVVRCVIWRGVEKICKPLIDAGFTLEQDLQVMFEVKVDLSRKWGNLNLEVVGVVAEYTMAKVAALRDVTNTKLKEEGLFSNNKKYSLPKLPSRLGIITSSEGTVINDFRASLDKAHFGFELFWAKTKVQGNDAVREILQAIKALEKIPNLDAILIFRGGGSAADLATFNNYLVARAVCECTLPVISAIGHQEDHTSVQDVSFLALGVPKDIGRFFSDIVTGYREKMREHARTVRLKVEQMTSMLSQRVHDFSTSLHAAGLGQMRQREKELSRSQLTIPTLASLLLRQKTDTLSRCIVPLVVDSRRALESQQYRLQVLSNSIILSTTRVIELGQKQLLSWEQLFATLSPQNTLKLGYALIKVDDKIITSSQSIENGQRLAIEFHDGIRTAIIETNSE